MIYHGEVELAPDNEIEEDLDPWFDPDEEDRLRLLQEGRELDRWEIDHNPTNRELRHAGSKHNECVAERVYHRRTGTQRSSGRCRERVRKKPGNKCAIREGRRGAKRPHDHRGAWRLPDAWCS